MVTMKLLLVIVAACFPLALARSVQPTEDVGDTYLYRDAFNHLYPSDKCNEETSEMVDAERVKDEPTGGLYNLSRKTFYVDTILGISFVMFFGDGSDLSHNAEVTWKKVAKSYEDTKNMIIGQVNCNTEDGNLLCTEQGVLGAPIVKYYYEGNEIESHYISENSDDLISYIREKTLQPPPFVEDNAKELTNETIKDVLSTGITFLKMFHPECGFCRRIERIWKQLSNEVFDDTTPPVLIAKLNCKKYQQACLDNGCRGFPTMLVFENGQSIASFNGPRTPDRLKEFVLEITNGYQPKKQGSSRPAEHQDYEIPYIPPPYEVL